MDDNGKKYVRHLLIKNILQGKEEYLLSMILFCTASITCFLLYRHDNLSLIYFGDSISHIVRARQFIDSQHAGIINIGTVWLPLPHLLLIPFVSINALFYSGTAGAVLGIPLLVGTGLLLFSMIELLIDSRPIAFLISLLFCLNPNVIYIALTPMNEISLIFFVTLGGYALLKWIRSGKERWMALCAAAVLCATLCRYEAWLLAPFISIVAIHRGILLWKQQNYNAAVKIIFIQKICWIGIVFWPIWNYFRYGDPLKFAHWTYSVGASAVRSSLYNNPQHLFFIIGNALLWIFGPMMLGAGVLMVFSIKRLSTRKDQRILLLFFSLPVIFILAAILTGFVQIDQWWWNWRFFLSFGLFLSVASALSLKELFQKVQSTIVRSFVVICFCAMPIIQITVPSVGVAVYNDAVKSFDARSRSAEAVGKELQKKNGGGSIALLTGYGVGQRIMISSGLPVKTFNVLYFPVDTVVTLTDQYIVLGKDRTPESAEFSIYWSANKELLLQSYHILSENNFFVLLERKK